MKLIGYSSPSHRHQNGRRSQYSQQMTTLEATEEEEANARQLAELEFIQSAYTNEEAWAVVTTTENEGSSCRSVVRLIHLPAYDSNSSNDAIRNSGSSNQYPALPPP